MLGRRSNDQTDLPEKFAELARIKLLEQEVVQECRTGDLDSLAVAQRADCCQQLADIVGGVVSR